ncbi:synaptotagmin-like protein 3 [Pristis pectinata]|uniref:synaptotagmin-like protein 3 n=1 Tax=Pristis pectinata TaxID=685728 RepID=UPI00223CBB4F|nr:synaptotagmin-like protein 3 [Pristis pectinata]
MNLEIDIKSLKDRERDKVLEVLQRDEKLRKVEEERIRKLKSEYQEIRRKGAKSCSREYSSRSCARCQAALGLLFNKGIECSICSHRVCSDCCIYRTNRVYRCIVCHTRGLVKVKSGEWFIEEKAKKFHHEQDEHKTISEKLLQSLRTLSSIAIVPPTPPPTGYLLEDKHSKGFTRSMENLFWSLTDRVRQISKSHEDVVKNTQLLSASYMAKDCELKKERSQSDTALTSASKLSPTTVQGLSKVSDGDQGSSHEEAAQQMEEESISSINSTHTGSETMDKANVTGEIELSIQYNFKALALEIHIKACKNLASGDGKKRKYNPYVKTYLLPDKSPHSKLKSSVKKNTVDPVFNETLRYNVERWQLEMRTLHVSVWYSMTLKRQVFVGQVHIPFENWKFEDCSTQAHRWYQLQGKVVSAPS